VVFSGVRRPASFVPRQRRPTCGMRPATCAQVGMRGYSQRQVNYQWQPGLGLVANYSTHVVGGTQCLCCPPVRIHVATHGPPCKACSQSQVDYPVISPGCCSVSSCSVTLPYISPYAGRRETAHALANVQLKKPCIITDSWDLHTVKPRQTSAMKMSVCGESCLYGKPGARTRGWCVVCRGTQKSYAVCRASAECVVNCSNQA
jgi:hypothetical protein